MPYQLEKSNPYHSSARYVGCVRVGGDLFHMYWEPHRAFLYGVDTLPARNKPNFITVFPTYQILERIKLATPEEEIVILPSVLPYWERYRPDEVSALSRVSYLTAEPPRASRPRFRRVSPSKPPTPEGSLAHRLKMLSAFVDDLEKSGALKFRDIKKARNQLALLQTTLEDLLQQTKNAR